MSFLVSALASGVIITLGAMIVARIAHLLVVDARRAAAAARHPSRRSLPDPVDRHAADAIALVTGCRPGCPCTAPQAGLDRIARALLDTRTGQQEATP